ARLACGSADKGYGCITPGLWKAKNRGKLSPGETRMNRMSRYLVPQLVLVFMSHVSLAADTSNFNNRISALNALVGNGASAAPAGQSSQPASGQSAAQPNGGATTTPSGSALFDPKQQDTFNDLVGRCAGAISIYDTRAEGQRHTSEWIAIGGAVLGVAGAALAGHVAIAIVSSLSGLSGAANTTQKIFQDNGDTSTNTLLAREDVRKNARDAIKAYNDGQDFAARQVALNQLFAACMLLDPVGLAITPSGN
ncbi:hypothetical protein, partial [Trinickia diaoshuihuensis]|uniref:hypothetical protein n=1 Tax=Trinickia diaoshuihuensis TaxID=2292265 RepID=UPI001966FB2E